MAVEYTSIATTGGWSTNTVKAAWDLGFRTALNPLPTCYQFIDVQPENLSHRGDSQTIQVTANYSEATVTAAKGGPDRRAGRRPGEAAGDDHGHADPGGAWFRQPADPEARQPQHVCG